MNLSKANLAEIANIKLFKQLNTNRNGYDAAPLNPIAIEKAIGFINEINNFDIDAYLSSPGPNGEVMVQLKKGKREMECVFYSQKEKYVLFNDNTFQSQGIYTAIILPELLTWLSDDE